MPILVRHSFRGTARIQIRGICRRTACVMGGLSGAVLSVIKIFRLQYNCRRPVDWRDSGVTGLHFNGICPAFSRRTFANYASPLQLHRPRFPYNTRRESPPEIVQHILLLTGSDNPIGPPRELLALLLTCHALYSMLSFHHCTALYATIFAQRFDSVALQRRHVFSAEDAKHELRRRFYALQCFRRMQTDSPSVREALITALFMITENDALNSEQLAWARFPRFINTFLCRNVFVGAEHNHRWPLENMMNTLAVNVAWFSTSLSSLRDESEQEREEIMRSLRPFAFAAFRYSPLSPPETQFHVVDLHEGAKSSSEGIHGPYRQSVIEPIEVMYLGHTLMLRLPPIAILSLLSYFGRLERIQIAVAPHLPLNRVVADAQGREGPTQQDIIDFNSHPRIYLPSSFAEGPSGPITSKFFDFYWSWIVSPCNKPASLFARDSSRYFPGYLSGHWRGTAVTPDSANYRSWLADLEAPVEFGNHTIRPFYCTLREHYCYSPSLTVPLDDKKNGILNAWLPTGCRMIEHDDGIEFFDEQGTYRTFYETYRRDNQDCTTRYQGVVDVIVTGRTAANRGAAWGMYKFIGRVRLTDGATVLLKEPVNPDLDGEGSSLMRGIVTPRFNFVGRWRGVSRGETVAELETAFVACKAEEP